MQKQLIWLGVILGLAVLVYGWVFLRPGPPLEATVAMTQAGPTFMFDGRVEVYEVKVTKLDASGEIAMSEDGEGEAVVWHMVPRDVEGAEPEALQAVTYGQPRGLGLRPAPGTRGRGQRLEPGVSYVFEADTGAGVVRAEFTMPGPSGR